MRRGFDQPDWGRESADWPDSDKSRFVRAGGLDWRVVDTGKGDDLLLLHGTGASSHSYRDLAPLLAPRFRVIAPDLPGHGFTTMPGRDGLTLPGMARQVGSLVDALGARPAVAIGHSAGAAVLIAMTLLQLIRPRLIVSLNGALKPIRGAALFSPLAKLLFLNPVAPRFFAWRALSGAATRRLIEGTGSNLDDRGVALYQRLFSRSGHVAATIGMMAHWDLDWLLARLGSLDTRLLLLAAGHDRAVPPSDAAEIARLVRHSEVVMIPQGGHLIHEERPAEIATQILAADARSHPAGPGTEAERQR